MNANKIVFCLEAGLVTALAASMVCAQDTRGPESEAAAGSQSGSQSDSYQDRSMMTGAIAGGGKSIEEWWPNRLELEILHQNSAKSNPLDASFDYAEAFATLDLEAVKADIKEVMTTSQDWWPADWGTYGPLFIRMAWHSAGTYRVTDGRGGASDGAQRFAPLNSWPDNANLDKARRLLWPVKKKYGRKLSWADLMILAGNCAFESAGLELFGFGGGRADVWEPQEDIYWGPEGEWLADARHASDGRLANPLAAVQMGLIYVNPEGPNGEPEPLEAAEAIRTTFGRMAMNDEETVALIAGGHTLGKVHGAAPTSHLGPEPEAAPVERQGLGWENDYGTGKGADTITSGLEGAWTPTPTRWSSSYLNSLFRYDWELIKGPGGAWQWTPKDAPAMAPDAHVQGKKNKIIMLTTDIALIEDPAYREIARRFADDPEAFNRAFARAWYKLTHRDMGPHNRLVGPNVPPPQIWQDPVPPVDHELIDERDTEELKARILRTGLTIPELIRTAWASASTFRDSDKRGGANGARIALAPQKDWEANEPRQLRRVLARLGDIRDRFNDARSDGKRVSLADLIVLGGCAAVERAAERAGHDITVPFVPGRTDATPEMTDEDSIAYLRPMTDGFRNFVGDEHYRPPEVELIDRANQLTLTAPEMTVLVGGLRVLGGNHRDTEHGVLTERKGMLTNDFFVNLLDMGTEWKPSSSDEGLYIGYDRQTGQRRWTATKVDLVFGANAQLRALCEVYAADDAGPKFVEDFAAAWSKVMHLDRFDLDRENLGTARRSDSGG